MGQNFAYLAIKGLEVEQIWNSLRLSKVADHNADWQCIGSKMRDGYYVIEDRERKLRDDTLLARLSSEAEVLCGTVSETVNYSAASRWSGGQKVWFVAHHLDEGPKHLQVTGTPPPELEPIVTRVTTEFNATPEGERHDFFFSIPLQLFGQFTGFDFNGIGLITQHHKDLLRLPKDVGRP